MNAGTINPRIDHDFNARESVASFDDEFGKLTVLSDKAMADLPREADIVFDRESGSKLDLYGIAPGRPVFLWIHGGYWRLGTKEGNAFAAPGLVDHGIAVAVMDYSLAPAVSLEQIVHEVRAAVSWLHRKGNLYGLDARRIHVGGSSAGGHLTGAVIADGWRSDYGLPEDVIGTALALSGIYDLEPLLHTQVNTWMNMNMGTVAALSPIRHIPQASETDLILSVGGQERDGFLRETAAYHDACAAKAMQVQTIAMPKYNHFDITGTLSDPASELVEATARSIQKVT
ncbi:N-acetylanthranilate amidase [Sulfitobacter noctilucicola]|uniref:Arylformamidase n=1 Tax=Sulfitobacter noctilucicola TaxID=1342301 RepID=A0A7W6MCI1_9RHOB|nr:alpha/beta hydrolase [Sulfitobacter noctilucicola]KIN70015.1 N-acetylanthranilate amidase [Sulfitobacter noctilucicola]MBB4176028.1 arylformamidase [Sulfitobacter noctilucicola]